MQIKENIKALCLCLCEGNPPVTGGFPSQKASSAENGAGQATSHYLNQCSNIVNWTLGKKLQWDLNQNLNILIQENGLENVVWKMAAILSWPQCVKFDILLSLLVSVQPSMTGFWRLHFVEEKRNWWVIGYMCWSNKCVDSLGFISQMVCNIISWTMWTFLSVWFDFNFLLQSVHKFAHAMAA